MPTLQEHSTLDIVDQAIQQGGVDRRIQGLFTVFVLVYFSVLGWFCTVKVMAFDELLSFYTARAPSVKALLHLQRTSPVSLDPPLPHLAAHGALWMGIAPALAMRWPSLLGAVVMVLCSYKFTSRLAGKTVAVFAVIALLMVDDFHLVEARPYGVMLGLAALALLLWQNVLRQQHKTLSLLGLFFTLGLATSSHYFGILLIVPFVAAELLRSVQRRKLDPAVLAALTTSPIFAAGWLPFLAGAHQYKQNYYIKLQWTDLARAYTGSTQSLLHLHSPLAQWLLFIAALALIAAGARLGYTNSRQVQQAPGNYDPKAEWFTILAFALLPLAGVILARVASGAFEVRYVIEFTLGTCLCLVAGALSIVRGATSRTVLMVACCLLALGLLGRRVRMDALDRSNLEQVARETTSQPTVITDKEEYLWLHAYHDAQPGPAHALWVADLGREIHATGSDNIDRTMLNLKTMAGLPVISYDELTHTAQPLRLIVNLQSDPTNWLPAALANDGPTSPLVQSMRQHNIYQIQTLPKPKAR